MLLQLLPIQIEFGQVFAQASVSLVLARWHFDSQGERGQAAKAGARRVSGPHCEVWVSR
ncbi:hypothetical protein ABE493_13890 [Stenotrophomonas terrae]|uniref:hypothetical protein n=1 Tax=Stenotrophomonas terrae TaxID=405446 RepID=UPI003209689B